MLKYFAVIFMLLDHVNLYIFDRQYEILTYIGRLAFPLFIYLSVNVYMYYTKNKIQYIERIFLFALITLFTVQLFVTQMIPFNILFTIALGLSALWMLENKKYEGLIFCFLPSLYVEYSFFGVLAFVAMYNFLYKRDNLSFLFLFISLFLLNTPKESMMIFLFVPLMLLDLHYKIDFKTSMNKYFFYFFYPLHLVFLGVLK